MIFPSHTESVSRHDRALNEFRIAAESAEIVSFDLFDTLVSRIFAKPTDVFAAMGARLAATDVAFGRSFAERRVAAECKARIKHASKADVTLEDVYRQFDFDQDGGRQPFDVQALMDLECETEVASIVVNPQVRAAFDELYKRKRCIITSDMYLPRRYLARILAGAGIPAEVLLFLSNESGGSKRDGSAWPVVRELCGLGPDASIVHLDDNAGIAGTVTRLPGLTVVLLSPPEARLPRRVLPSGSPDWFRGVCDAMLLQSRLQRRDMPVTDQAWLEIAHTVVLPLVLGLARKVRDVAQAEGIDRVCFLARDGLIVKKMYDGCFRPGAAPTSPYLLASRRCLNFANVTELDESDIDFFCSGSSLHTVRHYLDRIGLDLDDPAVCQAVGCHFPDAGTPVQTELERASLRRVFRDLAGVIESRARVEREPLLAHLDEAGLFAGRAIVVDVGWHGSLQRSLGVLGETATGAKSDLLGVYVGLIPPLLPDSHGEAMQTRPWLFDAAGPAGALALVRSCVDLVELFFSAPEHGVDHLEFDRSGRPVAVRTSDHEESARIAVAALFHEVVAAAAERLRPFRHALTADVLDQAALSALEDFLYHPTRATVRAVGSLSHAEGFGGSGYRALIPKLPAKSSRWNLKTAYDGASWKEGFMASLDAKSRLRLKLVIQESRLRGRIESGVARLGTSVRRRAHLSGRLSDDAHVLVVVTAHHVESRLEWLRQTLAPFARYPCPVHVIVNINDIGDEKRQRMKAVCPLGLDVEFRVQRDLETPFHLVWCHKGMIVHEFLGGAYTHFLYIEDDIVIEPETFLYWVRMRAPLRRHGLIPGFVRVEKAEGSDRWVATDQFGSTNIDWMRVRRAGGMAFTNLDSPYTAGFVLDRELAKEHVVSPSFTEAGSAAVKSNWGLRERAAMGPCFTAVPRFFVSRMVVPFDRRTLRVPDFARVVHAAGNYVADPGSDLAKLPVESLFVPPSIGHFVRQRIKTAKRVLGFRKP